MPKDKGLPDPVLRFALSVDWVCPSCRLLNSTVGFLKLGFISLQCTHCGIRSPIEVRLTYEM